MCCTNYCVLLGVRASSSATRIDADVSEDGEILSDDDDDDDFESLDRFPINEVEPEVPIEYDAPVWRPLVSFPPVPEHFLTPSLSFSCSY